MKKTPFSLVFLSVIITAVTASIAFYEGRQSVWIMEFKTYQINLVVGKTIPVSGDIYEFMKARYYYLANKIPKSYVEGSHDYGTVSNLNVSSIGKGPTTPSEEYRKFQELKGVR